jgi:ubiquinone/menaquinone biosynthesis C-methylase UbiE
MRYHPKNRTECKRLSRPLKEIDVEIQCSTFRAKEKDLKEIMKSTERYYQEIGHEYDEIWFSQHARGQYKKLYFFLQRKIAQLLLKKELVLDAGCGTCEWAAFMLSKGASVVGLDRSSRMLKLGKEKALSQRLTRDLNPVRGDLGFIPFREEMFDGVTILFMLGHLLDNGIRFFLGELARVVKNEGWMLFADTRLREPHQQQEHVVRTLKNGKEYIIYKRYFIAEELKNLLEQQLSRSFSTLELDSYVICVSSSRE